MPLNSTRGAGSARGFGFGAGSSPFITATGGTVTTCGDFKIHTFTGPGSFIISSAPTPANNNVDYLVVAGGGGGAYVGGGGAGGFRESYNPTTSGPYTASPLATPTSLPVSVTTYPITVGGGGADNAQGSNSIFSTITSTGGGPGRGTASGAGGSGGGGSYTNPTIPAGTGNSPPTSPPQGNPGGVGFNGGAYAEQGGGGGGATQAGSNAPGTRCGGSGGGTGINPSPSVGTPGPSGSLRYFAGGAGGGTENNDPGGSGGTGGGGNSIIYGGSPGSIPQNSTAGGTNTGGGGGAYSNVGGSGIVIIRYKFK